MTRDVCLYLDDIVECIDRIQEYTRGVAEEEFQRNGMLQDAVVRRLEIIGEAVSRVPPEFRAAHPGIPWQDIVGMRNRLIHQYFGVQLVRVWKVVQEDIPVLKGQMADVLRFLSEGISPKG